jgi:hypothetical protein
VATTPEGRRLTEAHRKAQLQTQQSFLTEFLDIANLDFSTPNWLRVVMQLIDFFRQDSADLALRYARRYREFELPDARDPFPDIEFFRGDGPRVRFDLSRTAKRVPRSTRGRPRNRIPTVRFGEGAPRVTVNWRDRDPNVEATLRVTGPIEIKRRIKLGEPPEQARKNASAHAGGGALRHVGDGGRDTMLTVVNNDRQALGWIRQTAADPCAFCSMLASRGISWGRYNQKSFAASDIKFAGDPRNDSQITAKVHDNCVVPGTLVTGPTTERGYRRSYEGELIVIGLTGGGELSITPNHPVLTDRGWVDAGLLREGDRVVRRRGSDLAGLQVPHEDDVPTPIEDVWGSDRMRLLRRVPVAAEDFHGDAGIRDGDVDVVASDGQFADELNLLVRQELAHQLVASAGLSAVADSLSPAGHVFDDFVGFDASSNRGVGRFSFGGSLLRGELCDEHAVGLRDAPTFDARLFEPARDDMTGDPAQVRDLLLRGASSVSSGHVESQRRFDPTFVGAGVSGADGDATSYDFSSDGVTAYASLGRALFERLAGGVELCGVREVRRIQYSGHVLNLQTVEGWYSANDVIVSNCRCTLIPVYFENDPALDAGKKWRDLWNEYIAGRYSGKDAINAWRRLIERPELFKEKNPTPVRRRRAA